MANNTKRKKSPSADRPNMSDVRIVLLGKSASENNKVGNLILNKKVFVKRTLQPDVETFSERLEGRNITVISTTHLINPKLTLKALVKKASDLSDPEPDVIILVLQNNDFNCIQRDILPSVLNCFGDQEMKRTMILTTDDEKHFSKYRCENEFIQQISAVCGGGRLQLQRTQRSQILQKVDEIITRSGFKVTQQALLSQEHCRSGRSEEIRSSWKHEVNRVNAVLLGKNVLENNRVGNIILGQTVFDTEEHPEKNLQHQSQRVGGKVKNRPVTLINSFQLLQNHLSLHQMAVMVRECVRLSDPGPQVFIIVLQYGDFTEEDRYRSKSVLREFSEGAMKYSIVITTDQETYGARFSPHIKDNAVREFIKECEGRHLKLEEIKPEWCFEFIKTVDRILKENKKDQRSEDSVRSEENKNGKSEGSLQKKREEDEKMDLNMVLCGNDGSLLMSVSKRLRGKRIKASHERSVSEVCVKKEEKIEGRLLSLVELPALSRLSEEEVMIQTLHCVSLCPGVHVFIIVVHVGPLTDEEKTGIEKILKIFDSREHFMLLFISDLSDEGFATVYVTSSPECKSLISRCGGQYRLMGLKEPENSRQIPDLLDYIENMKTEPYSPQMYVKAQENRVRRETEEKYEEEMKRMKEQIKELKHKGQSEGAECENDDLCLRIVLIGRTGSGKSATGNTILGIEEFVSKLRPDSVTTVCKKRVGEVDGRSVAVVDTPGLFDTTLTNEQVAEEIVKCVSLSSPGPHVFVIVLSLGRFTKEETDTVDLIKKIFGPKSAQFTIVLFTRGDDLKDESIEDYVRESKSEELKKLIRDCGNRFMVFNNNEKQDRTQVIELLQMIEELKNTNQGRYFTNNMFEEAEMNIKKRMEEIMKEREREIEAQKEKLRVKYEMEMEKLKKSLEDEKIKADEERKQRENEFRQKEEEMIKEFEEKHKLAQQKREMENQKRLEEEKLKKEAFHQEIEELKRENEKQRLEYEKQQKLREEEDRKREEKYRQNQETMKNEQESIIAELQSTQQEETEKRDLEEKRRIKEEKEERERWERKIKEAENDRKEIQEEIKRQQKEWEDEKKRQMREREEEERNRKEKHEEQLRGKQEELEKMRKRFEREREEERQKMEEERQKQRREREEKEREYEEKKEEIKRHYEELERERKEEWERRKREDEEKREEERKRWKKMIEDLKQEQEEEMKRREREEKQRKEREEKERCEMKQKHEDEMKEMKKKHEGEARKQAEETNEFKERKEQLQQELEEHQKEYDLLKELHQRLKEQNEKEINELQNEVKNVCLQLQVQKEKEMNELKRQTEALNDLLKERKGEKIESLQEEIEKLCQSLREQKGDKIQELQEEAEKLCQRLQEMKEEHLKQLNEETEERKRKSDKQCVIQ